ncbi:unnamed protein product, partial [Ectocarpus sp. 8 AP-2014]
MISSVASFSEPMAPVTTTTTDLPLPEAWDIPAAETCVVVAVAQGGDETPDASADYAGFEPVAPDSSRICRVVRGRRCRPERIARKRAIHKPFRGETQPIEIIHGDRTNLSTSDDTTSTAGAVDVFFSVDSIATSS